MKTWLVAYENSAAYMSHTSHPHWLNQAPADLQVSLEPIDTAGQRGRPKSS